MSLATSASAYHPLRSSLLAEPGPAYRDLRGKDMGLLMPSPHKQSHAQYVKDYMARRNDPNAPTKASCPRFYRPPATLAR